jgi:hypothetical protein
VTRVRLSNGANISVDLDADEVVELLEKALGRNGLLEIRSEKDDKVVALNPVHILYIYSGEVENVEDVEPARDERVNGPRRPRELVS